MVLVDAMWSSGCEPMTQSLVCGTALWKHHTAGEFAYSGETVFGTGPLQYAHILQCMLASRLVQEEEDEEEAETDVAEAGGDKKGSARRRWRLSQWLSRGSSHGRRASAKQQHGDKAAKSAPTDAGESSQGQEASGELPPSKELGPPPGGELLLLTS